MSLLNIALIKESGIDQIGRLSLHRAGQLAAAFGEKNTTHNKRTIETELKIFHSHKSQIFAQIHFQTIRISSVGVLVGIRQIGTSSNRISPFYRVSEMLVKRCY